MRTETVKNLAGGMGSVTISHILEKEQMKDRCRMYAKVTIQAGSSLGYHEHHGESETYFILSGEGEYDDNGSKRTVKPGDVTFTPSGSGHGIKPIGGTPLVFMALIILD